MEALAWPGELIERHGWEYEIWSGADRVLLENVRFLEAYRRPGVVPGAEIERAWERVRDGDQLADAERRLAAGRPDYEARPRAARSGVVRTADHRSVPSAERRLGPAEVRVNTWTTPLRTGLQLTYDGEQFTIAEIEGRRILLQQISADGRPTWRQIDLSVLMAHPSTEFLVETPPAQPAAQRCWASSAPRRDDALTTRFRHVQEVRSGYQLGYCRDGVGG